MSSLPLRILAILAASLGLAAGTLGDATGQIPPLNRDTLVAGLQRGASYGDPAFDALLDHTHSWGRLMHRWAANASLAPPPATPTDIERLLDDPDGAAGTHVVIFAELLEREPVPKYANVERWLVAPLDPARPDIRPDRASIVFVDRTTSAALSLAEPGRFVHVAARFYKPLVLPRRTTGEEVAYPSFVGASFGARQKQAESATGLFAYVGLGVALMIAVFVTLVVIVSRLRSKPSALNSRPAPLPVPPFQEESGLPVDPIEAMKRLADRGESADNQPDA